MKCPETGILQAYMDGELDIGTKKDIDIHLRDCRRCSEKLGQLREADDFTFAKMTEYKRFYTESRGEAGDLHSHGGAIDMHGVDEAVHSVGRRLDGAGDTVGHSLDGADDSAGRSLDAAPGSKGSAFRRSAPTRSAPTRSVPTRSKGVFDIMKSYKKYIAAACAAVVLVTCISVQPVRAVISDALSIFRVDNFKGLKITPKELAQLKENLSKGQGDITLDKLGKISMQGGQSKTVTADELKRLCNFPLLFPDDLEGTFPEIRFGEPTSISFTLNTENANTLLKSFKSAELLPAEIDGKTFKASFGAQAALKYDVGGKTYDIIETTSPDIEVPEGVDADQLFKTLVNVPVFPEGLKARLESIGDWKNTLYIPVLEDSKVSIDEVTLNGVKAFISSSEKPIDNAAAMSSRIIWMDNGVIYGVASNTGKSDLMDFAKRMAKG